MQVTMRIKRFDPERDTEPHWEQYTVDAEPTERVLDLLHKVKWDVDGTLTFRRSCGHGVCGSDGMMINGRNALACQQLVADAGPTITIEPLRAFEVIKDLVVDMEEFFEKYRAVMPHFVTDDDPGHAERLQSPEERARYDDTTKCILCACCTSSCPVNWGNPRYVGPAAIVNAHRFIFDSRDVAAEERLDILSARSGAFRCRTVFNCTDCCPRGIKVTQAISEVKRAILHDRI